MKKIKVETVRKEANVQIIPVNASLVAKTITAMNRCEMILFFMEKYDPENKDLFKKEVCDFLKEMYDAFLEMDEE